MIDAELRTLILETTSELPHVGGVTAAEVAEAVLAKIPQEQREAVLLQVFEWYVQDTVDAALDFLKAQLS